MSFIKRGYDRLDEVEKQIEERSKNSLRRFWLKPDADNEVSLIFLTDNPPIIEEHQLKIDGNWQNWFTCLKNLGEECPLCQAGDRPSTVGFYVVLDRSEYKDRKGNVWKDQVRVLAAKFSSLKEFKRFSKRFGGLEGMEFSVARTDQKAPSIGDSYIHVERWDADELEEVIGKPLEEVLPDWEEYLAPKSAEELRAIVGSRTDEMTEEDEVDYS